MTNLEIFEGLEARQTFEVTGDLLDSFIQLSGDSSRLHIDDKFAINQGFDSRIVHGALLLSLVSQFVGLTLPGPKGLWLGFTTSFPNPCYAPCGITVHGVVSLVSIATNSIQQDISVTDDIDRVVLQATSRHKLLTVIEVDNG